MMQSMMDTERRTTVTDTAVAAAFVLGLEARQGTLTVSDYQVAVQRLQRAVRPWDVVIDAGPRAVGVVCTGLVSRREVEALAARLADVVRAPMAVGDEIHSVGVCVGSAELQPGEDQAAALTRAKDAMQEMRRARDGMLVPDPRD